MEQLPHEDNKLKHRVTIYRSYFLLMTLQGVFAVYQLLRITRDPKYAVLFGLSTQRLVLIFAALTIAVIGGFLAIKALRLTWLQSFDRHVQNFLSKKSRWSQIVLLCIGFVLIGSINLLAIDQNSFEILAPPDQVSDYHSYFVYLAFESVKAYLIRLQPLLILYIGLSIQTIVCIPLLHYGIRPWHKKLKSERIYGIAAIYGLFLILWGALGWRNLRLETVTGTIGWYPLGAPILDIQVTLIFLIGLVLLALGTIGTRKGIRRFHQPSEKSHNTRIDLFLGLIIWSLAAAYWVSVPAPESWFSSAPRSPNFESYPNSDATLYDINAHNLQTGMGFRKYNDPIGRRPAYTLFLASLYTLVSEDHTAVTLLQSALFGIFPALVYLLTSTFHTRFSGLIAAALIILREANAITLANKITLTHSKHLMSEMPAAIGVVLFAWVAISWFKHSRYTPILPLVAGGILAVFMQVRIEVGVLLPVTFLFAGVLLYKQPRVMIRGVSLIAVGIFLFLAPWIWRNWDKTGLFFLEYPGDRLNFIVSRSGFGRQPAPPAPETIDLTEIPDGSSKAPIEQTFLATLSNHYAYNQVQAVLIFPDAFRLFDGWIGYSQHQSSNRFWMSCCSSGNYVDRFEFWSWRKWDNLIPLQSVLPILANLFLIAIGITKIWEKNGILGLFPLVLSSTHYLLISAVQVSGGRFVHIVEWVWILYFSVGFGQVMNWIVSSISTRRPSKFLVGTTRYQVLPHGTITGPRRSSIIGVGIVITLLGASLPLSEALIKPRYTEQTKQQRFDDVLQSNSIRVNYPDLAAFMKNSPPEDRLLLDGRAIYPRYYAVGEGEPGGGLGLAPSDAEHFYFFLVGPRNLVIHIPLDEQPVIEFPNAADVLVFGCKTWGSIVPMAVFIDGPENVLLSSSFPDVESCSDLQKPP